MKAPIIVLEGLDACGKSTQTDLLLENLEKKGFSVGFQRFPGYKKTPAGLKIAEYLRGERGEMNKIDPKIIASLYAADRLFQLEEIERMSNENDLIIFDRGTTSNFIYTSARGENLDEVRNLQSFVESLEYEFYGLPKESLVIFLDASEEARQQIHAAKNRTADLHESDEFYLKKVRQVAIEKCKNDFRWINLSVDRGGTLRTREDLSEEILALVLEKIQDKS